MNGQGSKKRAEGKAGQRMGRMAGVERLDPSGVWSTRQERGVTDWRRVDEPPPASIADSQPQRPRPIHNAMREWVPAHLTMAISNVAPLWPGNEVFEPTPSCLVHTCGRIPVLFISALIIPLSAIQTPLEDVRCPLLSVVISCEMEMSEMPGARVLTLRNKEAGVEAQNNAGTLTSAREMQSGRASGNWLSGWSRL